MTGLVDLLEVERLGEVGVPHLHDERAVEVEEPVARVVVFDRRVVGLEVIREDKVGVGDGLLCPDDSDLVLLEELERRVRVRVLHGIGHDRRDVAPSVLQDEVVSSWVVVDELGDLQALSAPLEKKAAREVC